MANPNPSPENRWQKGYSPKGRPNREWIRKIVNERNEDNHTEIEQILRHQIEVAKSWEVRVIGRDGNGELLKVASGADSTKASAFICGLIGLKPIAGYDDPAVVMALAEHFRQAARDQIDIALRALGAKASTMQPEQIAEFVKMCSQDARGFLRAAEDEAAAQEAARGANDQPQLPATTEEPSE
jgi:hypothetical protein